MEERDYYQIVKLVSNQIHQKWTNKGPSGNGMGAENQRCLNTMWEIHIKGALQFGNYNNPISFI